AAAASDSMQNQAAALARVVSVFKLENTPEAPEGERAQQAASIPVAEAKKEARVVVLRRPEPAPRLAAANEWHEF
ncbi:MAG TPA: methyl-accepting chemotaxis protein, partial [Noviherbaspirillum sp.]|nr:methyl-accepting chemotaxis protein [Noviherbaspirillum sp.]